MALLKLDIKLITPYWKWLLLFFGIALLIGVVAGQDGTVFMISFTMFAGTFTAFNFENTEKSNLNVLFATLPTNRKSMLFVRYLYTLIVLALSLFVAISVGLIIDLAFGNTPSFTIYLMFACLSFGLFLFNTSFQTPFFYAKGYMKGRIFLWIPIIIVMIALNLPVLFDAFNIDANVNIFEVMFRNITLTNWIAVTVGVASIIVSYLASRKIYLKKDF